MDGWMDGWMDGYEWMYTDCDQVQLARLIGQLHYSAMTAGCEDSAAELRDMHVRMLMSGDELQQVNGIRSLPDFARHDSAAVAAHIERCCGELVRLLHPSTGAGGMEDSTRLHLLDAFVFVVPAFVRRLDEDVLQNEVGISGGAPLTHQVQHPKTLQGLNHSRVSACFVDAVCKLLELATETRQQRWVAEGSKPSTADAGVLPPIPGAPDRCSRTNARLECLECMLYSTPRDSRAGHRTGTTCCRQACGAPRRRRRPRRSARLRRNTWMRRSRWCG